MDNKPEKAKNKRNAPKKPRKITATYLRNSGLFYLQRFPASSGHFKTVMLRKVRKSCNFHKDQDYETCAALVDDLTNDLLNEGLLDDKGYITGMVNSLRRAGKSSRAITAKLAQKRVPAADIETALKSFDEDNHENAADAELCAALKFARKKKLGAYDTVGKYEQEKALAMLGRQGFSYETSRSVLNLDMTEIEDIIYKNAAY